MKRQRVDITILLLLLFSGLTNCVQIEQNSNDYLVSFTDSNNEQCGYKNEKGDIIIPLGKYGFCFTDTFKTYAIVVKPDVGFIAIDRQEHVLYKVFPFDNGPDYPAEGLFRILQDDKIGFADAVTGQIIIKPQFDCAFAFVNGTAKVSTDCTFQAEGEHITWISENWFYIDKTGKKVAQAEMTEE